MTRTITHLYDTYEEAARAVTMLEDAGVGHADISLVGADHDARQVDTTPTVGRTAEDRALAGGVPAIGNTDNYYDRAAAADPLPAAENADLVYGEEAEAGHAAGAAGAGASIGTVLGGGAGLLAGIGALAIPGVGPVVAAGWLIATIAGAGAGAAAGGILGALVGSGTSEEHAHVLAEGVRRGGALVSVRVAEADAPRIEALLAGTTPVDPHARGTEYRSSGWSGFEADAPAIPVSADAAATPGSTMGTAGGAMATDSTTMVAGRAALDPLEVEKERARAQSHV